MKKILIALVLIIIIGIPIYLLVKGYFNVKIEGKLEVGDKVPDFTMNSLNGEKISSKDYLGSIYLLVFFNTRCPDCLESLDNLKKSLNKQKDLEIKVLLVSKDNRKRTKKFVEENRINFSVFIDEEDLSRKKFKTIIIPSFFLINDEGILIDKIHGYVRRENNEYAPFF